jgi:mRNA interferase YafQ
VVLSADEVVRFLEAVPSLKSRAALTTAYGADMPLPIRHLDHPLAGEWSDHRDCHIRPDLVLIYRKPDAATLQLVRLGSHSELGL